MKWMCAVEQPGIPCITVFRNCFFCGDGERLQLEFSGDEQCRLFLDGESLGERAWAPFAWRIPGHFAGRTVEVKIVRSTSCGPMFGTKCFESDGNSWLSEFHPHGGVPHPVVELIPE